MSRSTLPTPEEIIFSISEAPLGKGSEATVYKVHTNPKYTVRVSENAPAADVLSQMIFDQPFVQQKNIFGNRNYGQPVAYLGVDPDDSSKALVTINLYVPGFSMEVHKPGRPAPSSEEALMKTLALSKAIVSMPDSAIDKLYDDLHFLSSREYSIDVWNGGLFTNTGNILYSASDKEFRIIDIQPFIRDHIGIPSDHKKGFNTPFYLVHGLMPGAYTYANDHAKYPPLIDYRTEIVSKVIAGAKRNHLNDLDSYLTGDMDKIADYWRVILNKAQISEKYIEGFVKDICSVTQENRYPLLKDSAPLVRVGGRSACS